MAAQDFDGQNLVGNDFSFQDLNDSSFFKTRLENVLSVNTLLQRTNFREVTLINVNASGADLADAQLNLATFQGGTFDGVNFLTFPVKS